MLRRRCVWACCIAEPTVGKYCGKHWPQAQQKYKQYSALYERDRQVWDRQYQSFYKSSEWKIFRLEVLSERPICEHCRKNFSNTIHHIIPLKEDWSRRLDKTNVESVCSSCHSSHELKERNSRQK